MVQLLLDAGANPNAKTLHGTTALIAAAMEGDGAAAGSLLKTGADPALEDEEGNTAESESCDRGEAGPTTCVSFVRKL